MKPREIMEKALRPYGLMTVKETNVNDKTILLAELMPLPAVIQTRISVVSEKGFFRVSSGLLFNSREVDEETRKKLKETFQSVARENEVEFKEIADSYMFEKKVKEDKFHTAVINIYKSMKKVNDELSRIMAF